MKEVRIDDFYNEEEREQAAAQPAQNVSQKPTVVAVPTPEPPAKPKSKVKPKVKKRSKLLKIIVAILAVLVIAGLAVLVVFQYRENEYLRTPEGATQIAQQKNDELVQKVSVLVQLPNEDPAVAEVEDISNPVLQNQPFFANAQNGDKVLIFPEAAYGIIYRPSENRIINAGPIALVSDTTDSIDTTNIESTDTETTE